MERVWHGVPADSTRTSISFSEQDLEVFSDASGDRNPLHLCKDYARRTPYGQQVIFGCLGAMACLGRLVLPESRTVTSLQAEFRPMFLGVNYRVETSEKEGIFVVQLFDGGLPVVSLSLTTGSTGGSVPDSEQTPGPPFFEHREAVVREPEEIIPGLEIAGEYAVDHSALAVLSKRWGDVDSFLATILCWSSYLVGMELPGASALFSKMALHFDPVVRRPERLAYQASVASVESRFSQIRMEAVLRARGHVIASGQLWSFVRPRLPEVEQTGVTGVRPDALFGRAAAVIGASRGLGAAMRRALDSRGASVYSLARSPSSTETPLSEVGDAADPLALRRLRDRVVKEQGRLDFLICNACPPMLPLRLEASSAERVGAYINLAVSLALTPLCWFLDLLNSSNGCAVIISSLAVEQPVSEWPHYIAAKQAVEMLARVASLQYPRVHMLIVRPPKLLTTLTNTPMGRLGAMSPGLFANHLATRLEQPLEPGRIEIFT